MTTGIQFRDYRVEGQMHRGRNDYASALYTARTELLARNLALQDGITPVRVVDLGESRFEKSGRQGRVQKGSKRDTTYFAVAR